MIIAVIYTTFAAGSFCYLKMKIQQLLSKVGVLQGSLLRPLLFNIFINKVNFFDLNIFTTLRGYYSNTSPTVSTVLQFVVNSQLSSACRSALIRIASLLTMTTTTLID